MKRKLLSAALSLLTLLGMMTAAGAAEDSDISQPPIAPAPEAVTVVVNGRELDLSGMPRAPYWEGETLMLPLQPIALALGYRLSWNATTGAIMVDDDYIQRAVLFEGSAQARFQGELQIIDMSRDLELAQPVVIHEGRAYVPMEFFREFLNDAVLEGNTVSITPSRAELDSPV